MSKTLIIAEKPSVSTDLSKVLPKIEGIEKFNKIGKGRDYFYENDTHVITSAVGHLVQLKMPTGPNGKNLPWKFDVLPAIPDQFELVPIEQSESRLKQVLKLCRKKEVTEIINACDAGREGELIFKYILELGNIKKPVRRLWMRSMTNDSILEAWNNLRSDKEMSPLSDAAKCRSESDWLVGLNSTRALTCFRSRHGGFNITTAGRVQTPTLAILALRESEIRKFTSTSYFEIHANFQVSAGEYKGTWIDTAWKKDENNPHSKANRLWNKQAAESISKRCENKHFVVSEQKKPTKQISPQLYDLTSLQREASTRYGFSAGGTLKIAQSLYERHKMLTYPRTDSRYLPEDYMSVTEEVITSISKNERTLAPFAKEIKKNKWLKKSKRVFDNTKISDHFAIIPTGKFVKLSEPEQKIFDLVCKRFLAVFFPHAEFENTRRETIFSHASGEKDTFLTTGKVLTSAGWLAIYGRKVGSSTQDELCPVQDEESAFTESVWVHDDETKPPARFNEATLLSAMEGAGKLIEDEDLREAMSERGLGTPATRAATIEALIRQKYIARDGREIYVSPSGMKLIETLHEIGVNELTSPEMTGDWEYKLHKMEQGELNKDDFMQEIISYTTDIVEKSKKHAEFLKNKSFPDVLATCPKCLETDLKQTDSSYVCKNEECGFKVQKHIASRFISESEVIELCSKRFLGPLENFKSRFNRPFEAALEVDKSFKVNFVFARDEEDESELTDDMITGKALYKEQEYDIYSTEKSYFIPALKNKKAPNGVKLSKVLLQQEIDLKNAIKILNGEKSTLLEGFVSNRTKRPFSAFLIYDFVNARPTFDFPPRATKKSAKKATKKVAKKTAKKVTKKATKKIVKKKD